MPISIDDLRKRILEKHQRELAALAALETLKEYLTPQEMESLGRQQSTQAETSSNGHAQDGPAKSNRDKVFDVIFDQWATLEQIRNQTGLTNKQIWGVVTAPHLKGKIAKRDGANGQKEYHVNLEAK